MQKQLLPCSAPGNSPNLQRSHGNALTTRPLLPVWDRQPGTPCLGEPAGTRVPKPAGEGRPDPNQRGLEAVPRWKLRCAEAALLPQPCCLLQQRVHVVQHFLESCWSRAGSRCPWNSRAVAWPVLLQAIESSGCVMAQSTRSGRGELVLPLQQCGTLDFGNVFPCSCGGISLPVLLSHSALRRASCLALLHLF